MRFDRAAEFLAACASGDTEEAQVMLLEANDTKRKNEDDVAEVINCSNADGITALHQVRRFLYPMFKLSYWPMIMEHGAFTTVFVSTGLHRWQHGDSDIPFGEWCQCEPGGQ